MEDEALYTQGGEAGGLSASASYHPEGALSLVLKSRAIPSLPSLPSPPMGRQILACF